MSHWDVTINDKTLDNEIETETVILPAIANLNDQR